MTSLAPSSANELREEQLLPRTASGHDERPVFGYLRVSTDGQELERQERTVPERHANLPDGLNENGLILFADHGISAYKDVRRPDYEAMWDRIDRAEASAVIIDTSSRLTRKGIHEAIPLLLRLQTHGTRLFTTQGREYTPDLAGLITLAVDAEADNAYSRTISHNVSTGKARLAEQGYWTGEAPTGYLIADAGDGNGRRKLVIDPETAPMIRDAFESFDGGFSKHEIAKRHAKGPSTVLKWLRNPNYLGGKKHEPLVSPDLFERVQARLASNRKQGFRPHGVRQPFGPVLKCATCGSTMCSSGPDYRCDSYDQRCAKPVTAKAEEVEAAVIALVSFARKWLLGALESGEWKALLSPIRPTRCPTPTTHARTR